MTAVVRLLRDTYLDSVVQLSGTRAMRAVDGVEWATAAMATAGNIATLEQEGFDVSGLAGATAGDLVLAVRADGEDAAAAAEQAGRDAMFSARGTEGVTPEADPASLADALTRAPGSTVAVISVPGDYAALETHRALSAGLHVLLFSDNVPLDDEIALKERATGLGLLVMGPGAGTAMLGRTCLGFANVVADPAGREQRVAVVAAAGTGAQEAAALLDRFGVGVTDVIGLGGRDLTKAVGGPMGRLAVRSLVAGGGVDAVLLVSKPPDPDVARSVLAESGDTPLVASLIGLPEDDPSAADDPPSVTRASTLEGGVLAVLRRLGRPVPDTAAGLAARVDDACRDLPAGRTLVRGLFSGGTLCYESLVLLERVLGPVYSNTPIDKTRGLPAPDGSHVCLDLGEEEYTQGRPHPMIDPEARVEHLRAQGAEPDVAAILLDVVLGYGAHPDPAAELGPVCREITADGGPRIVVYVLGTEQDPQGFERQRAAFTDAGCVVAETAARASLAAAAIALRDSSIVGQQL